jgi:uncharacterized Zn-binding protein involved in type VI secretion
MEEPAARLTDFHKCDLSDGPKPHVGGPISGPGVPTVLIGGLPAAVMGDLCVCVSPAPDVIIEGSMTVHIGGRPAARKGSHTAHGGEIKVGDVTVLIGGPNASAPKPNSNSAAVGIIKKDFESINKFESADDLIKSSGKLERKGNFWQGKIKGDGNAIFNSITKNGKPLPNGRFLLADGTNIGKHLSTRTGEFTINMNKAGNLYKIRINP